MTDILNKSIVLNTKDSLRLRVPLDEATRPPSLCYGATGVTDFWAHFILGSGDNSRLYYGIDSQQMRTPSQSEYS
jgi:hypothetical protein